jgi:hypothetical protein
MPGIGLRFSLGDRPAVVCPNGTFFEKLRQSHYYVRHHLRKSAEILHPAEECDRLMNETTKEHALRIAEEMFPGCAVEFGNGNSRISIELNGKLISTRSPTLGMSVPLDTDDQMRSWLRRICPEASRPVLGKV